MVFHHVSRVQVLASGLFYYLSLLNWSLIVRLILFDNICAIASPRNRVQFPRILNVNHTLKLATNKLAWGYNAQDK